MATMSSVLTWTLGIFCFLSSPFGGRSSFAAQSNGNPEPRLAQKHNPLRLRSLADHNGQKVIFCKGTQSFYFSITSRRLIREPENCPADDPSMPTTLLSSDNRLEVRANSEGTISWFSTAQDKARLVTLIPGEHPEEWVLFTPSGYYDTDEDGQGANLAGWDVLQADGVTRFTPLADFRSFYQRPLVINETLVLRNETLAIDVANQKEPHAEILPLRQILPPKLQVRNPPFEGKVSSSPLQLEVRLTSPSGEDAWIEVVSPKGNSASQHLSFADGRTKTTSINIRLPRANTVLILQARTKYSIGQKFSTPLRWVGSSGKDLPTLHLVAVGVSEYPPPFTKLSLPSKDALDIVAVFRDQLKIGYSRVVMPVNEPLLNGKATRSAILDQMGWLSSQEGGPEDVAVLFLAGHGLEDTMGSYFVPVDGQQGKPESLIGVHEIQSFLARRKIGRAVIFLDACHSGGMAGMATILSRAAAQVSRLENGGVAFFAASTKAEASKEFASWGNGAFTRAVVRGLRGKADLDAQGKVTVGKLMTYVNTEVRKLTKDEQTPIMALPSIADFPLTQTKIYQRRWFQVTLGLAGAVAGAALLTGLLSEYAPLYDSGNTRWLVRPP